MTSRGPQTHRAQARGPRLERGAMEGGRLSASAFRLQFPAGEIEALAARFAQIADGAIHGQGAAVRARGYYRRAEFLAVCSWKTPRSRPKVQANSPRVIRAATSVALSPASSEQSRM